MKSLAFCMRLVCILFCITLVMIGTLSLLAKRSRETAKQVDDTIEDTEEMGEKLAAGSEDTAAESVVPSEVEVTEPTAAAEEEAVTEPTVTASEEADEEPTATAAEEADEGTTAVASEEADEEPIAAVGMLPTMKKGHRTQVSGDRNIGEGMAYVGSKTQPAIALTFDDGPSKNPTTRILDVLESYQVHATFFVMGYKAEDYADQLKRAKALGCELGNHSYNHPKLTAISDSKAEKQISRTRKLVKKVTGTAPSLVRPPYGSYNDTVLSLLKAPAILWSLDTRDWKTRDADSTVNAVLSDVKDGDIVLMHDVYEPTADAVERLVPELIDRGYQLVTVHELAALKGEKLKKGKTYIRLTTEE